MGVPQDFLWLGICYRISIAPWFGHLIGRYPPDTYNTVFEFVSYSGGGKALTA